MGDSFFTTSKMQVGASRKDTPSMHDRALMPFFMMFRERVLRAVRDVVVQPPARAWHRDAAPPDRRGAKCEKKMRRPVDSGKNRD
ncbi:hypothetical protein LUTEI9C_10307 [Luteimonas sp. 9C]|nr:hypothetical protein LUTEI9C_10307 [Luteimonas sp. 9C]